MAVCNTQFAAEVTRDACTGSVFAPVGGVLLPSSTSILTIGSTAGQLRCGRFNMPCNMSATALTFRIATAGAAGSQCAAVLYSLNGNTKYLDTGVQACDVNNTTITITGLPTATLTIGTDYIVCLASSATATLTYFGITGTAYYNASSTYLSTAANLAQFNANCTAPSTPYTCCTGLTTGTCTGMPSTTGTLTGSSASPPELVIQ